MRREASNTFHVDRLIERMWQVRDRLQSDSENPELWQQWIFIRRVLARAIDHLPQQRPGLR